MAGRVRRKLGLAQAEELVERQTEPERCALCERPLGAKVEWHHLIPKSQGGRVTAPVHPICHRTIHALVSIRDLATEFADIEVLRARPDVQRYLRWIADKPPDFNAPTRRARAGDA